MQALGHHRPRNVDWKRAAGLLYGDWGTSKAYVIGLAFVAAGYSSLPIILAVCALTALVGFNYVLVCKHFPDGGGVYSAARDQSRLLAVVGALLLVANFTVTAAMSGWAAMSYFGVSRAWVAWATAGVILAIGLMNSYGPKHTGSVAVWLAVPMVAVVFLIVALSLPHLSLAGLHWPRLGWNGNWLAFVNVILALSGVEAIANLTGVMKLDPGSTLDQPRVSHTARWAIWPVAVEVVLGTSLLGWAMLSLPRSLENRLLERSDDMLRFLAEQYGAGASSAAAGQALGLTVGVVVGLLLVSAVNTAVSALIGLIYMLARDGEMPRTFTRLNAFGVPWWPMAIAVMLPVLVVVCARDLAGLANLYAIGVVGAIAVNLGSCSFNRTLPLAWWERSILMATFAVLAAVELTIAYTKQEALFFAACILMLGLGLRGYAQRRAGLRTITVPEEVAAAVDGPARVELDWTASGGQNILVAARGLTPVLRFALEEARFRQGRLYVLFVKELAVALPGRVENREPPRWQQDRTASQIMCPLLELARKCDVSVVPLYAVSENPAATILDLAATLGVDMLMLGAPQRHSLARLLKGNVVTQVARNLPENIQLLIHG